MLTITVRGEEFFDDKTQEVFTQGDFVLELEHSLVSLAKWEAKYEKPFLSDTEKTNEEVLEYIWCMIVTPDVTEEMFSKLSQENVDEITAHIDAKQTATWMREEAPARKTGEAITAELIYYWMLTANVFYEAREWHLNQLFTLLKVVDRKNADPKKRRPTAQSAADRRALNAARREKLGTTG